MSTFPELVARRLAHDPGRPLLTYYDDRTGERTELSATTFANWVAKTANLLVDELLLDPGAVVDLRLPTHWLGPVFLGATWSAGLVPAGAGDAAELVVTGPSYDAADTDGLVLACSLTAFATRFAEPLPEGVEDYGVLWPGQGDVFVPTEPVELPVTRPSDHRLLTDVNPLSGPGQSQLLEVLAGTGSLVLVGSPVAARRWQDLAAAEQADEVQRAEELSDS